MNIENIKNFIKNNPLPVFLGTIVLLIIIYHYYTKENFGSDSMTGISSCCSSICSSLLICFLVASAFR